MQNFRLQTLLARSPLSDEDRHNICTIFSVLSEVRKLQLLDTWDAYMVCFLSAKNAIEKDILAEFSCAIGQIDTLLDESRIRENEKQMYKEKNVKDTRDILDATFDYTLHHNMRKIREIARKV